MKKLACTLVLPLCVSGPFAALADVTPDAAYDVMIRAGTVERLYSYTDNFNLRLKEAIEEATQHLSPELSRKVSNEFRSFLDAQDLINLSVYGIITGLSKDEIESLATFYSSSLGKRIANAEVEGFLPLALYRFPEISERLEARVNRNPVRKALLERLDGALRISEGEASLSASINAGIIHGIEKLNRIEPRNSLENDFDSLQHFFIDDLRKYSILRLVYTFGPITDGEIREYLQFLDTEAGRNYNIWLNSAKKVILRGEGKRIAETLAEQLAQDPNSAGDTP